MECRLAPENVGPFDSLYVGGGTPSCLPDSDLERLVQLIRDHFLFSEDTECTLEANPDDLTVARLKRFRELGVNRLSLGVQSLNDQELLFLGRRHSSVQAERAMGWAREAGFLNLSVDLMYALPGQEPGEWEKTLKRTLPFSPEHLSCYQLTLEPHTPLGRMKERGELAPPAPEAEEEFFLRTATFLEERGFLHYEVSNYAFGAEHRCRHNLKYWTRSPYLGLGPSAHSHLGEERWWNLQDISRYCRALERGKAPVAGRERLSTEQQRLEAIMLGLRTRLGVPLDLLCPGGRDAHVVERLRQEGVVEVRDAMVFPTTRGLLLADSLPLLFPGS